MSMAYRTPLRLARTRAGVRFNSSDAPNRLAANWGDIQIPSSSQVKQAQKEKETLASKLNKNRKWAKPAPTPAPAPATATASQPQPVLIPVTHSKSVAKGSARTWRADNPTPSAASASDADFNIINDTDLLPNASSETSTAASTTPSPDPKSDSTPAGDAAAGTYFAGTSNLDLDLFSGTHWSPSTGSVRKEKPNQVDGIERRARNAQRGDGRPRTSSSASARISRSPSSTGGRARARPRSGNTQSKSDSDSDSVDASQSELVQAWYEDTISQNLEPQASFDFIPDASSSLTSQSNSRASKEEKDEGIEEGEADWTSNINLTPEVDLMSAHQLHSLFRVDRGLVEGGITQRLGEMRKLALAAGNALAAPQGQGASQSPNLTAKSDAKEEDGAAVPEHPPATPKKLAYQIRRILRQRGGDYSSIVGVHSPTPTNVNKLLRVRDASLASSTTSRNTKTKTGSAKSSPKGSPNSTLTIPAAPGAAKLALLHMARRPEASAGQRRVFGAVVEGALGVGGGAGRGAGKRV